MPAIGTTPVARSRTSSRGPILIASLALVVAACGGAAAPTPTPTSTPTPTPTIAPTPTPIDVAAVFLASISDPAFSARASIEGSIEMGITAAMRGTQLFSGEDNSQTMSLTFGTTEQVTESITLDGTTWKRTAPGPWLVAEPDPDDDQDLDDWFRTLTTLTDLGVETKGGRSLHHLSAGDEPVPAAALGLDPATFADPEVHVEFYAEPDGTPAVLSFVGSWLQTVGGTELTVEFQLEMTLSQVGSAIVIRAPEDVWTTYTSTLGYSMAMPDGFRVENRDGTDVFVDRNLVDWAYVYPSEQASGLSLAGYRDELIDLYALDWGDPIEAIRDVTLGGEPGYRIVWGFEAEDGTPNVAIDTIAMHEIGWEVFFTARVEERAQVEPIFDMFLASFAFED